MKVFAVIAVTLALLGISSADEDKKAKILNFYKCISCAEDHAVKEEYMKCHELKPEKCKKVAEECKAKLMPTLTTLEERWAAVCKNEDNMAEKIYDCTVNHESRKDLTDEEKSELKEFIQCAKKLSKKFCDDHH